MPMPRGHKVTHGKYQLPECKAWYAMRARCNNKNSASYHRYGGRGISICKRWDKFENFLADMGPKPTPKHSLDRINNNGNYTPKNCRWATREEQLRNTRRNHNLTYRGITKCLTDWAMEYGMTASTLEVRLVDCRWPIHKALTQPIQRRSR